MWRRVESSSKKTLHTPILTLDFGFLLASLVFRFGHYARITPSPEKPNLLKTNSKIGRNALNE
jgi:hypothetical protein